ncbi:MAG: hypothetical protein P8X81_10100 [Woeseiaceae bacterium]|jgi:hypothetical protein
MLNTIDEGFVSLMSCELWVLDQDILLEQMRGNVNRAEESGDWSELQNRVRGQLTAALRL